MNKTEVLNEQLKTVGLKCDRPVGLEEYAFKKITGGDMKKIVRELQTIDGELVMSLNSSQKTFVEKLGFRYVDVSGYQRFVTVF